MSTLKSIATTIFSLIFIIFLSFSIFSYTMGDLIQKDSLKTFVDSQLTEETGSQRCEEYCEGAKEETCEEYCNNLKVELRDECKQECLSNVSKNSEIEQNCIETCLYQFSNTSKKTAYKIIDNVYDREMIHGINLNIISSIFKYNIVLIILTIISGISIFLVSEKPFSILGKNFIWVSISMLSTFIIPTFIITPEISFLDVILDYITQRAEQQIIIGIVLLISGIALIILGKKKKK